MESQEGLILDNDSASRKSDEVILDNDSASRKSEDEDEAQPQVQSPEGLILDNDSASRKSEDEDEDSDVILHREDGGRNHPAEPHVHDDNLSHDSGWRINKF